MVIGRGLVHCTDSVAVSPFLICYHFFLHLFGDRDSIKLAIKIIHKEQTCFLYLTYMFTVYCYMGTTVAILSVI